MPNKNVKSPNNQTASNSGGVGGPRSGGADSTKSPSNNQTRKDPNEEFFMMTLLSYKLTHKEYEKILAVS